VPLHKQSVDLPGNEAGTVGGAMEAVRGRAEVTREMRRGRREGIREGNFLKGMK
jgi:large subunit ribosomal protein L54